MKYFIILLISFFSISFLLQCNKKETIPSLETTTLGIPETTRVIFTPPPDSSINVSQIKQWLTCNPLLDSLAFKYADSFKVRESNMLLKYQKAFMKSQDSICRTLGLSGGYEEYEWILKNAGILKNKALFDSLRLKTF